MSLLEALLLDPVRMNVWVAARTDGVAGTGTQGDPFDGSTQAKFDGVMHALPMPVLGISRSETTATATALSHGFPNGSLVLIAGATGADASRYNGSFIISNVTTNTFQYTMSGTPSGSATGTISCRLSSAGGPMVPLPLSPPIAVRLGPGTFKTNGYADNVAGGWQARPAMKILGSGVQVTTLQLAGGGSNGHYYAVGHAVSPAGQPNLLDYFEISDLTIDCNFAAFSGTAACGAVRVMGNHARVRRLMVINWGTRATTNPCFVLSAVTATDIASVEDCGIEECVVVSPATTGNTGPITVLHAGGTEAPPAAPLTYGVAPYVRNCFIDAGESSPFSPEIRGLSMAWCKAGIIEGNQAHNLTYGTFQQSTGAQDLVVRNNWFKNVNRGIFLGGVQNSPPAGSGNLAASGGSATVTLTAGSLPSVGDYLLLNTNPSTVFDGIVVTVESLNVPGNSFRFSTVLTGMAKVSSLRKVFGVTNLTIEGNVVELATATSGYLVGIHANDSWGASTPAKDAGNPTFLFGKMIVRDNKLRYVDGAFASNYAGYGMQLNSAANLLVRNNVVESASVTPPSIQNDRCGAVAYFNNQTPAGVLIQGTNGDSGVPYEELSTIADFALVMGLFNRKT
jgi:hypothetical protein